MKKGIQIPRGDVYKKENSNSARGRLQKKIQIRGDVYKKEIQIPEGTFMKRKFKFREGTFMKRKFKFREGTNSNSARGRL